MSGVLRPGLTDSAKMETEGIAVNEDARNDKDALRRLEGVARLSKWFTPSSRDSLSPAARAATDILARGDERATEDLLQRMLAAIRRESALLTRTARERSRQGDSAP